LTQKYAAPYTVSGMLENLSCWYGNFSLLNRVQTNSGAHSASYPMGAGGSFPESKATGAWSWPITSSQCRGQECVELYLHSP